MNRHPLRRILLNLVLDLRLLLACVLTCLMCAYGAIVPVASAAPTPTPSSTLAVSCPVTNGPLTLKVSTVRSAGISPFLMFFDATGTTDISIADNATTFQHVTYTWDFGDFGASGTGTLGVRCERWA